MLKRARDLRLRLVLSSEDFSSSEEKHIVINVELIGYENKEARTATKRLAKGR